MKKVIIAVVAVIALSCAFAAPVFGYDNLGELRKEQNQGFNQPETNMGKMINTFKDGLVDQNFGQALKAWKAANLP